MSRKECRHAGGGRNKKVGAIGEREKEDEEDREHETNLEEALVDKTKVVKLVVDKWFVDRGFGFGKVPTGEIVFIHASAVVGAEVLTIGTDAWVQVADSINAPAQELSILTLLVGILEAGTAVPEYVPAGSTSATLILNRTSVLEGHKQAIDHFKFDLAVPQGGPSVFGCFAVVRFAFPCQAVRV